MAFFLLDRSLFEAEGLFDARRGLRRPWRRHESESKCRSPSSVRTRSPSKSAHRAGHNREAGRGLAVVFTEGGGGAERRGHRIFPVTSEPLLGNSERRLRRAGAFGRSDSVTAAVPATSAESPLPARPPRGTPRSWTPPKRRWPKSPQSAWLSSGKRRQKRRRSCRSDSSGEQWPKSPGCC